MLSGDMGGRMLVCLLNYWIPPVELEAVGVVRAGVLPPSVCSLIT